MTRPHGHAKTPLWATMVTTVGYWPTIRLGLLIGLAAVIAMQGCAPGIRLDTGSRDGRTDVTAPRPPLTGEVPR